MKGDLIGAFALIAATTAINVGCVAHAQAGAYAAADPPVVFVEPPTLVAVDADDRSFNEVHGYGPEAHDVRVALRGHSPGDRSDSGGEFARVERFVM